MFNYKKYINEIINEILETKMELHIETPPNEEMGEFAVSCFTIQIEGLKNPHEKAEYIKEKLNVDHNYIQEVLVVGPYVNFKVNKRFLGQDTINIILQEKEKYGSKNIEKTEKALIEHTSINPNASPHIGRARNSIIGDFLVNLYKFVGYDVETHYFINDIGKQIAMLLIGVEKYSNTKMPSFNEMLDIYININQESKENEKIEQQVFEYLNKLEHGDEEIRNKFKEITDMCVKGQQEIFAKLQISFDVFTHESDLVFNNITNNVLDKLKEVGKLKEDEENRYYVDLEGYNIPTKSPVLVLTRADKTSLYPLRDIAYSIYKMKLNNDNNFIVLGEDQEVYMKQIAAVLDILGYNAPKLISYSFILLNGDKMATREGTIVLLEDFIEETKNKIKHAFEERESIIEESDLEKMASSCIRYNILNVTRKKIVNFNLEEATNFQGNSAVYILYNYVRIKSILNKVESQGNIEIQGDLVTKKDTENITFENEIEHSLINDLYKFREIIEEALQTQESVVLTKYIYGLAQKFSKYYNLVTIINEPNEELRNSRIKLLECIKTVLENGMKIIGINKIDKM